MDRSEFVLELRKKLSFLPADDVEKSVEYYAKMLRSFKHYTLSFEIIARYTLRKKKSL